MFDWIGDAIEWIGDGISSLWDSTVGNATEAIGDWIWETMFEWLFICQRSTENCADVWT